MSLRRRAARAFATALLFASARVAASDERPVRSVELLAGYGAELAALDESGPTAFGVGLAMRAGVTFPIHLYVGGTFVEHLGWRQRATDAHGTSTYRGSYHVAYGGAEAGWAVEWRPLLLRIYAGAGLLASFGRTSVGRAEREDDGAFFYIAPGLFGAVRSGRWVAGIDTRVVIVPAKGTERWAPTLLFLIGQMW